MSTVFDVFISYHSQDYTEAAKLAQTLREAELRVWFDEWHLQPGKNWVPELRRALDQSSAIAVLVGSEGPGPWQAAEVGTAVLQSSDIGIPIIPVMLPGSGNNHLPPSLQHQTPIRYSSHGISFECLSQLIWAITSKRPRVSLTQMVGEFSLEVPGERNRNSRIMISTLPNETPGTLLDTTWETFGSGIERIIHQIKGQGWRLDVDACFGINEAGLVMATFLSSAQFNRCNIGYLKCIKQRSSLQLSPHSNYPELPDNPTIFICDFEVKYADVVGFVANDLRKKYVNPDLHFAVFGAMTEERRLEIDAFQKLTGAEIITAAGFTSVFIAAIMNPPGIEPPLELR
ncbi:toll/interleukin-1 receptor domain-containing protein [Nocardiopsis sinuspersici]|nr:toll/interleukin-1 receptor domain-containing protein [Nocardiopsis sinuspersici]